MMLGIITSSSVLTVALVYQLYVIIKKEKQISLFSIIYALFLMLLTLMQVGVLVIFLYGYGRNS